MPKLIPADQFEVLTEKAAMLLAVSREVTMDQLDIPTDTPADQASTAEEVAALSAAMVALCTSSPLMPTPLFLAMGSAIGMILAQQIDPHAELLAQMRGQMRSTYDDIAKAQAPQGTA